MGSNLKISGHQKNEQRYALLSEAKHRYLVAGNRSIKATNGNFKFALLVTPAIKWFKSLILG
jgi:hypothetical protein